MTKRECAIVTAYTGVSMFNSDGYESLYKYLKEIFGCPVSLTDFMSSQFCEEAKEKSKADFLKLCETATD